MLAASGWTVYEATDRREAAALLDRLSIAVVIAGGNWREFLALTSLRAVAPSVIVTAQFADEPLWAEVLNLGGYDVLAQPFDPNEVTRIVQAALRHASQPRFHLSSAAMGN
jgi:DNA-binding response OmpR family regulator